jgi:hypothetical protein
LGQACGFAAHNSTIGTLLTNYLNYLPAFLDANKVLSRVAESGDRCDS